MPPPDSGANDNEQRAGGTGRRAGAVRTPASVERAESPAELDPTDFSIDSADLTDSEPPLILGGAAESTSVSEADPSAGTVSEAINQLAATIDLPGDEPGDQPTVESASGQECPSAPVFRPTRRPPMAILSVADDGGESCEEVRIRKTPFEIGRLEGDLAIPHELQMSRRHLRVERVTTPADDPTAGVQATWTLTDLRSLNGTFIRRSQLVIRDQAEALLGGELVRFLLPKDAPNLVLVRVGQGRSEQQLTLAPGTRWIGSDPSRCVPFLTGNPFLDGRRLRLDADLRGRWTLTDQGSTNGVWVRIDSVQLEDGDEWQAGEQRFRFSLP